MSQVVLGWKALSLEKREVMYDLSKMLRSKVTKFCLLEALMSDIVIRVRLISSVLTMLHTCHKGALILLSSKRLRSSVLSMMASAATILGFFLRNLLQMIVFSRVAP
jgi:hypothetical protein